MGYLGNARAPQVGESGLLLSQVAVILESDGLVLEPHHHVDDVAGVGTVEEPLLDVPVLRIVADGVVRLGLCGPRRGPPVRRLQVVGHEVGKRRQLPRLQDAPADHPVHRRLRRAEAEEEHALVRMTVDLVVEVLDVGRRRLAEDLVEDALGRDERGQPPGATEGEEDAEDPEVARARVLRQQDRDALPFELRIDNVRGSHLDEFEKLGIYCRLSSDDGSIGTKGFVTESVVKWLCDTNINAKETIIYACGPEPMLAATAKMASDEGIDCQVSMERMMACGIGLCQSCAVKSKESSHDNQTYKLCCKDGPVFDAKRVVFNL